MDDTALKINASSDSLNSISPKAERLRILHALSIPTVPSYLITPHAFKTFALHQNLLNKIIVLCRNADIHDPHDCNQVSRTIQKLVINGSFPQDVTGSLARIHQQTVGNTLFSITLDPASGFKPVYPESSHFLKGTSVLYKHIRDLWALQFTPKAIASWSNTLKLPIPSLIITAQPENHVVGEVFTVHPISHRKDHMLIRAWYGSKPLDTQIPDHYTVNQQTKTIVSKQIVKQYFKLAVDRHGQLKQKPVPEKLRSLPKLSQAVMSKLTDYASTLQHQLMAPQHIIYTLAADQLFIVAYQPQIEATLTQIDPSIPQKSITLPPLVTGIPGSPGIVTGPARLITNKKDSHSLKTGEIIITNSAFPELLHCLKKSIAIVTELGGVTAHSATLARELGIPAVVAAPKITSLVKSGDVITINGDTGVVSKGGHQPGVIHLPRVLIKTPDTDPHTATKVLIAASSPQAVAAASGPFDGVGLIRGDLLLAEFGHHPDNILKSKKLQLNYYSYLETQLSSLFSKLIDKSVNYRISNLYTDQYAKLTGGTREIDEPNPILGFHGGARFVQKPEFFLFETSLIQDLFNKHQISGTVTIPSVRNLAEVRHLKKIIVSTGYKRSSTRQLGISLETPAMCYALDDISSHEIDLVLINSDILATHFFGYDLTNAEVSRYLNYFSLSFIKQITQVIQWGVTHNVKTYVHGSLVDGRFEAYSDLITAGVTGITVSPSVVATTRDQVKLVELRRIH
jgi:pyruvate, water dikinase